MVILTRVLGDNMKLSGLFLKFFLSDVICDGKFTIEGGVRVSGVGGSLALIFPGLSLPRHNKLNAPVSVDIVNRK